VNNASLPITVNNPGVNHRSIYDVSLKMDYETDFGTFTSISGYNLTKELYTGDSYNFLPIDQSFLKFNYGFDQNQSLFLRVRTLTQELRFTSPADKRFRWIAGAEFYGTERFISTGNEWDTGHGVVATFYDPTTPAPAYPLFTTNPNPQYSFLADSQNNFAWAGYLDTSFSLTDQIELSANVRYDQDQRKNTTETPQSYLDYFLIPGHTGEVRNHTFEGWQPQFIAKYSPIKELTAYASYSRGFRSGGFNQTGVGTAAGTAGFVGVGDVFRAEHAETYEAGIKTRLFHDHVRFNISGYTTDSKNGYFFVYLASNSTQNLGNIPEVRYTGFDADLTWRITDDIQADAGFGYTDSSVKKYYHDTAPQYDFRIGEQAPLVSRYTANVGVQWTPRINDKYNGLVRLDYSRTGPTYFWESDPDVLFFGAPPVIKRDPVDLVDLRAGVNSKDWSLMFWVKNLNNAIYNAEYSPGGFVFKALPRRWGLDISRKF
jgi:iron complex outermembrane receptor protein